MSLVKYALLLMTITMYASGRRIIRNTNDGLNSMDSTDEPIINLDPVLEGRLAIECIAKNNQPGICVHETYCNEEHTILPGGVIQDFELRAKDCKPMEWCCTNATLPPIIETTNNECTALDSELLCPWCVSLHRSATTEITASGLFCMGSMIGTKVILTAGTCIKAAQKLMLWAQVPSSANPKRNYIVRYRQPHQHYSTGSHEYDFGILVLEEDVDWGKEKWKGACLGLRTPLVGECVGFGFDADGAITSTLLTVKQGGCTMAGNTLDAACGTKFENEPYCIISPGSPVLCSSGSKGLVVSGVARYSCMGDSALLGSLSLSKSWLSEELEKMKVLPKFYQINAKLYLMFHMHILI